MPGISSISGILRRPGYHANVLARTNVTIAPSRPRYPETPRLFRRLFFRSIERTECLRRCKSAREFELLDIDHLPFHRDGHEDAKHGEGDGPQKERPEIEVFTANHQQGRYPAYHGAARGIAGGTGSGLHAVVLKDGQVGPENSESCERSTDREGQDTGSDGNAQAPSGLQADIEIGEAHHAAERGSGHDSPDSELRHVAVIVVLEPFQLDLIGTLPFGIDSGKRPLIFFHLSHRFCSSLKIYVLTKTGEKLS